MNQTACIVGASGLVGRWLIQSLIISNAFDKLIVLVRKPLNLQHPKVVEYIVDFENENEIASFLSEGNTLFICIGTTMNKVKGNKELYKKIDVAIPTIVAKQAILKGYTTVSMVSAVGANIDSGNFYLHVKGLAENTMMQLGFQRVHIYQPSLLMGSRAEIRIAEKIALLLIPIFNFFLIGGLQKYKGIHAQMVAKAMCKNVLHNKQMGVQTFTYTDIKKAATI